MLQITNFEWKLNKIQKKSLTICQNKTVVIARNVFLKKMISGNDDTGGPGEGGGAHEVDVHLPGRLPPLRDTPDNQALPPSTVPGSKHA